MHPIRIGVVLRFKNPEPWRIGWKQLYDEHLEYAAAVDRLGFDGIWVPEHHCIDTGYNPAPLTTLAALAAVTKRCWIGTQPLILPLHNPVLAAEQAATVDVLSGGRLILAMGTGFRAEDFAAVGIPKKERGQRSEEAVQILTRALRGEEFDFAGKFYDVRGVKLSPAPIQTSMGFQLAVRSAVVAKRSIRNRLDVNLQSREEGLSFGPVVAQEAEKAGIDPRTIGGSIQRGGFIGTSREAAVQASLPYLRFQAEEYLTNAGEDEKVQAHARQMIASVDAGEGAFTAEEWIETLEADGDAIASVGLRPDWVNLTLWHSGMPLAQAIDALEEFAEQVLPHIDRPPLPAR